MNDQVSISTANIRGAFGAFVIPGMYTALWAGFVPYLKAKLSIGEDVLGSMILLLGVGSCLSMAIAGKLVESFGCKRVVLLASFIGMVSLAIVTMCPTIATTTVALFFFGITSYPNRKGEQKTFNGRLSRWLELRWFCWCRCFARAFKNLIAAC